jgi:hypothetical protein
MTATARIENHEAEEAKYNILTHWEAEELVKGNEVVDSRK